MDYEKLIEQLKQKDGLWCSVHTGEKLVTDAADALTALLAENDRLRKERDAAVDCIYKIEDALDRGNDNDWAREHISEWESQKED
jgi:hypothetical protein|nr:MAG TPA: hypothetical protein [Caudoviricetes sp.]